MLKSLLKQITVYAVQNDFVWAILKHTLLRAASYANHAREIGMVNVQGGLKILDAVKQISPDLTVMHGPFQGMQYPTAQSIGSMLTPKLLGSYEHELESVIEKICTTAYSEIIDIGCAEGYYAVGLARRIRSAKIYAYDINPIAIRLCKEMAQRNQVSDRVFTGTHCDAHTLAQLPTERALILCDCEGCEKNIFTPELISQLARHDLLVEIHDYVHIETSALLRYRFQTTHSILAIPSLDDIAKARAYVYPELNGYSLAARKILLAENRPHIMEWFFMTPRVSA